MTSDDCIICGCIVTNGEKMNGKWVCIDCLREAKRRCEFWAANVVEEFIPKSRIQKRIDELQGDCYEMKRVCGKCRDRICCESYPFIKELEGLLKE